MRHIEVHARTTRKTLPEDPVNYLPPPARPAGPDRWICCLAVGPWHHDAVVTVGGRWRDGDRIGHAIAWEAMPESGDPLPWEVLTPPVHGMLWLQGDRVVLRASYVPPAGVVGRLVDLALQPVARRSMLQFVRDVADRLSSSAAPRTSEEA